ncbi:arsenate reductase (glutaredoxin) [Teredinibacter haidensis]|uniref:arsenate reductase (glutaredoxin) n=1 Tax=Teredinibacter haidensis TaxID=2731755 RepID=UPI000948CB45|nr:arsenate reductase (glutaredoxin) [Teredinibacter haidensis]
MTNSIRIYHNPRCSKSRQTLALIEDAGITPDIVLYLETPPSVAEIKNILNKLNISARDLLRKGEASFKENQLSNTSLSDEQIIEFMVQYPKLIERPIVVKGDRAVLGRPPENVNALLG